MSKLTDNEIIKALELLLELVLVEGCLQRAKTISKALDLINRQKAAIEELDADCKKYKAERDEFANHFGKACEVGKAEAIKEFAERFKDKYKKPYFYLGSYEQFMREVDNLVKEMTENITKIEHNSLCETETYKGGE